MIARCAGWSALLHQARLSLRVGLLGVAACTRHGATASDAGVRPADGGATPRVAPSLGVSAAPAPSAVPMIDEDLMPVTLAEQRAAIYRRMRGMLGLSDAQLAAVRAIVDASPVTGQGSPKATTHPMTRAECRLARERAGVIEVPAKVCAAPFMAPLYDRASQGPDAARVCIDRYEFPGIPCEYPLTWVSARDAAALCSAVGKRLCDAHEWEGACAGAVRPVETEYHFGKRRIDDWYWHNKQREIRWAYGPTKDHARCATGSHKSRSCDVIGFDRCGSNTYPAGAFPGCQSPFGVFDQHGNVAEHMNFPMESAQLAGRGGLGMTEMKGSWFLFGEYEAHPDDCRWRAPSWHETQVSSKISHENYHLGFRCCRDVAASDAGLPDAR